MSLTNAPFVVTKPVLITKPYTFSIFNKIKWSIIKIKLLTISKLSGLNNMSSAI